MGTAADRSPYAEQVHTLPDGTALFALQSLTADDLAYLREAVGTRRLRCALRLADMRHNADHTATEAEADRLDLIAIALQQAHDHATR